MTGKEKVAGELVNLAKSLTASNITYDDLDDVVHECAKAIGKVGVRLSGGELDKLNDVLSEFLADQGVEITG